MHSNLCGETCGLEDTNFAPPVGNNQQLNLASIPFHHRTPLSGVDGPTEDPSESNLLELPPSLEPHTKDMSATRLTLSRTMKRMVLFLNPWEPLSQDFQGILAATPFGF